ncbi:MAG: sigma-70 family RNA polymerase sigma factor [Anaerolineales bacterium]
MRDDSALLQAIRRFDEGALEELFDSFAPVIFRYAMRLIGNVEDANDVVGEVFSELLKQLRLGRGPRDNLRAYLYQIAYHKVVDMAHKSRRVTDLDDALPLSAGDPPDEQAENSARLEAVVHAIRHALTEIQQHVLTLRFIEGLSLEETARVIGKDVNNVKAIQSRGVAKLRQVLQADSERVSYEQ